MAEHRQSERFVGRSVGKDLESANQAFDLPAEKIGKWMPREDYNSGPRAIFGDYKKPRKTDGLNKALFMTVH